MKYFIISLFIISFFCLYLFNRQSVDPSRDHTSTAHLVSTAENNSDSTITIRLDSTLIGIETVLSGLNVPWEIAWGPDGWIWFTEEDGRISKVNPDTGEKKMLLKIPDLHLDRLGMLSMVLHTDIKKTPYVFLNYIVKKDSARVSRLVRYYYNGDILMDPVILKEIPGNTGHNGSRLVMGPDGKILWATGDASCCGKGKITSERIAQNPHLLNGKILRINIDGSIPSDNPVAQSEIWATGFRVPQGLVYASNGLLYSAEHGDAIDDELNLIRKGRNYGYPDVTGICDREEEQSFCSSHAVVEPLKAWTPTIAPAGIDYYHSSAIPEWHNSLLMVTLKTQSFRVLNLSRNGNAVVAEKVYLEKMFGRMRDICVSPEGDIYISTSNQDWNPAEGFPKRGDDRILRIYKVTTSKGTMAERSGVAPPSKAGNEAPAGSVLYTNYCASCHKSDGEGVKAVFPPLKENRVVTGNKEELISILLKGMSGPIKVKGIAYNQPMPAFNFLSDRELADVLTYIRSDLNNRASEITDDDIADIRKRK